MIIREILFRGQRKDNKELVYGFKLEIENLVFIVPKDTKLVNINHKRHFHWDDLIEVIPDTVGQFTGSYDKQNKRKVFEGDKYEFNSHKFTVEFIKDTFIFESVSKGRLSLDYLDTYNIKFLGIFEKDLEDGI